MSTSTPFEPNPQMAGLTVRYSLKEILAELAQERSTGSFGMEKLNQAEILKLFENKKRRRGKKNP
jgi:hypothetical protein